MTNVLQLLAALLVLASGHLALAQTDGTATYRTPSQVLDDWVTNTKQLVVPAADAMPEDKYSFAPSGGEFHGVRAFAEQVKHLAASNYQLGARILGEQPPPGTKNETAPDAVKTKAEIMAYLEGSFECLHRAALINDQNQVEPLPGASGTWQRTRLGLLIDALAHSSNHYGQMVEYLRMNRIVPPASR
jgi:uncharacterized damage-inducible protein DinB